jgi:hypothetical protein
MTSPTGAGQEVWDHALSGGAHSPTAHESAGTKLTNTDDRTQNIEAAVSDLQTKNAILRNRIPTDLTARLDRIESMLAVLTGADQPSGS